MASEPGVLYAPLYYKTLEIEKDRLLKVNFGNFEAIINVDRCIRDNLQWWIDNVDKYPRFITCEKPFLTIKTDSSLSGWGAVNENSGECIQGVWDECETREHINYLELKAGL